MRIVLDAKAFETLVKGEVLSLVSDSVKVEAILSDIGFDMMQQILDAVTMGVSVRELGEENTILRALVAQLHMPCHYCGVSEMSKCPSGFPGCALADDIIAGEYYVAGETHRLREEIKTLKAL